MYKTVMIGSRALAAHSPSLLRREPSDLDLVTHHTAIPGIKDWHKTFGNEQLVDEEKVQAWKTPQGIVDYTVAWPGSSDEMLLTLVQEDPKSKEGNFLLPSLDVLFTIKSAHRYKKFTDAGRFYKHFTDWHILNALGCKVPDEYKDFLKLRRQETYTYAHSKLNVSKDEFFTDDVPYMYNHDWIHQCVALDGPPAYTKYLIDEVECSKELFDALPLDTRIQGVIEEACVLAIERSLVPHGTWSPKQAWMYAFAKVCSTITSGWFRRFAYDNGLEIIKRYPEDYWERFQSALATNPVYHKA